MKGAPEGAPFCLQHISELPVPVHFTIFRHVWCGAGNGVPGSVEEYDTLHSCHFEPLAAADVLAAHEVVLPDHVALSLGEFRAVMLVRSRRQRFLLSPHRPGNVVVGCLVAVRTVQRVFAGLLPLFEKVSLIHRSTILS